MLNDLKKLEAEGKPIRVGLVGVGAMGRGIAWQINNSPGMELVFVGGLRKKSLINVCELLGKKQLHSSDGRLDRQPNDGELVTTSATLDFIKKDNGVEFDVLVEATNSVGEGASYGIAAMENGSHVVMMNAEIDMAFGPLLHQTAEENGVICTSDAGDQHGVLSRMIEEIELWGFEIVQAGNMKGFLNRYATAESLVEEAAKRNLDPIQCCSYTDGSKLNIEMSLLANCFDLRTAKLGMEGPRAKDVTEAVELFDFDSYNGQGMVDYLLGAVPGGGVYVIAKNENEMQRDYLDYYKVSSKHPYYLFYRPYHLCHLETPRAIALAVLYKRHVMPPYFDRKTDVYAYAKKDLKVGDTIAHSIGGDEVYSMIQNTDQAAPARQIPVYHISGNNETGEQATILRPVAKDSPLCFDDLKIPTSFRADLLAKQAKIKR